MTTTTKNNEQINTPTQRFTKEEIKTAAIKIRNEDDEQEALLENGSITPDQYDLYLNRRHVAYVSNLPAGLFDVDGYMIKPLHMWTKEEEAAYEALDQPTKPKKRQTQKQMFDYYKSKPYTSKTAYEWNVMIDKYGHPKHLKVAMCEELSDRCAAINN